MSSISFPICVVVSVLCLLQIVWSDNAIKIFCGKFQPLIGPVIERRVMVEVYGQVYYYAKTGLQTYKRTDPQTLPTTSQQTMPKYVDGTWHETKMKAALMPSKIPGVFESFQTSSNWQPDSYDNLLNNSVHFVLAFVQKIVGGTAAV
uniref:Secreted protein n=1 Tax=Globodera pallida TaxID=36090 RepID=A0A183BIG3_GLOPA